MADTCLDKFTYIQDHLKFTYMQDHLKFTYIQDHLKFTYIQDHLKFTYIQDHFFLTNQNPAHLHKKPGDGGVFSQSKSSSFAYIRYTRPFKIYLYTRPFLHTIMSLFSFFFPISFA